MSEKTRLLENAKIEYRNWLKIKDLTEDEKSTLQLIGEREERLIDSFSSKLQFGTSGLRGLMDIGPSKMNRYVIRKVTLGLSDYLKTAYQDEEDLSVLISYDSRENSREFAFEAGRILSAQGIHVKIFSRLTPVSVLSYGIINLKATMGIMVTASHNPREYNGYKVYNQYGYQILRDEALLISKAIDKRSITEDFTLDEKNITVLDDSIKNSFLDHVSKESSWDKHISREIKEDLNIIYTPLHGSGLEYVTEALEENSFSKVSVLECQREPDPTFTTCTTPNPELLASYDEAFKVFEKDRTDLIIATDPDCDRLGVALLVDGKRKLLSGNQIGILFIDFLVTYGEIKEGQLIIKSIVSTPLVEKIGMNHGLKIVNTLTGFKFMGEILTNLEKEDRLSEFLFAFEESFGYLFDPFIRDKDGITTSLLLCKMAALYKSQGKTLYDRLEEIYEKYGRVSDITYNYYFHGIDEMKKMNDIMEFFRGYSKKNICGKKIVHKIDYLKETGLPKENAVQFDLENDFRFIVRPSGTEPKLKLYIFGEMKVDIKSYIDKIIDEDKNTKK